MQTNRIEIKRISHTKTGDSQKPDNVGLSRHEDMVVIEEPLQVILRSYEDDMTVLNTTVMTTMRTPGHDIELVQGWLNTQVFLSLSDIQSITQADTPNLIFINVITSFRLDKNKLTRLSPVTSSCGICGDTEIEKISSRSAVTSIFNITISQKIINTLVETARIQSEVFNQTGGSHASAIYNLENGSINPRVICLREDVGRHNALDKAIGSFNNDSLTNKALVLSGRVSADLMQKVICAGIPVVISVGAPSNLAVELAESVGVVLIGFVKRDSFNIYAGLKQITVKLEDEEDHDLQSQGLTPNSQNEKRNG
jgi:FdhD protein